MEVLDNSPRGSLWLALFLEFCFKTGTFVGRIIELSGWIIRRYAKRVLSMVIIGTAAYYYGASALQSFSEFVSTMPAFSLNLSIGLFAAGFFLLAFACVVYVVLSFMERLIQIDSGIAQDIRSIPRRARRAVSSIEPTDGKFIPYDEERQALHESLKHIQASGALQGVTVDDLVREGQDLDIPDRPYGDSPM